MRTKITGAKNRPLPYGDRDKPIFLKGQFMLIRSDIEMSGSKGGTTFARNRFGAYARQRTKPVNPSTERQQAQRSIFALLTNLWNTTLTQAQRDAWDLYAANVPMLNRLGQVINPTGFNHYCRSNSLILQVGGTRVDDAPQVYLKGEQDPTFEVTGVESTQELSITFDGTLEWANEVGGYMAIFLGLPQMTKVNFFKGPWRYAGNIKGAATPPTSPQTINVSFPVTEGQKIWAQARIIRSDGRVSDPFRSTGVVGA